MVIYSQERPPKHVYDRCVDQFGADFVDFDKGTIFTVGNTIYSKQPLTPDFKVHEETHVAQQEAFDGGHEAWWDRYLEDVDFRYSQELEAYRNQWRWIKKNIKDRNGAHRMLMHLAKCLSGKMYGSLVTLPDAIKAIKS